MAEAKKAAMTAYERVKKHRELNQEHYNTHQKNLMKDKRAQNPEENRAKNREHNKAYRERLKAKKNLKQKQTQQPH